jgi:two-component system cell cycle response regulator
VVALKLLIVEDDGDQRDLLRETLEDRFGIGTVTAATTMAETLALELSQFDLILCDYNLPDCTGLQLLEQIRKRCMTPVIMVTGENVGHTAVEAIKQGATDYVVKVGEYLFTLPLTVEKNLTMALVKRENERLRQELERALIDLRTKAQQLEESLQRVEQMAATDPLTGLYNRRHLAKVLEQLFAESQRFDTDLSCVMIDLDGYKRLNDTYGHQVGDKLLVAAGKVIGANMRQMDVAARYGGDEFVLLLPRASDAEAANAAQRIRDDFKKAGPGVLGSPCGVSMSVGIASLKRCMPSGADQLIACADAALYRAKDAGRDRIETAQSPPDIKGPAATPAPPAQPPPPAKPEAA